MKNTRTTAKRKPLVFVAYASDATSTRITYDVNNKNEALVRAKSFVNEVGGVENFKRGTILQGGKSVGSVVRTKHNKLVLSA
jgi:hypothetical protein